MNSYSSFLYLCPISFRFLGIKEQGLSSVNVCWLAPDSLFLFRIFWSREGGQRSRSKTGMCFMLSCFFCSSFRYLAGTEEGHIHKCSCSYNEQYLENYHGHTVRKIFYLTVSLEIWKGWCFICSLLWLSRISPDEDCVGSQENVCVGGYKCLKFSVIVCYSGSCVPLAMVAILVRRLS